MRVGEGRGDVRVKRNASPQGANERHFFMSKEDTCPREYLGRPDADLIESIGAIKSEQGERLTILGHHYQTDAIVDLSDFLGDSFKLCRDAANATARYIVFCGVRFMAESARVLARPEQAVQHPEETAGCPMADMADLPRVEEAWDALSRLQEGRRIIPITYMNSDVELKAFCGRNGGAVCTSSNASKLFDWAYSQGDTIFFFPDEHLGRNTAHARGQADDRVVVWDPRSVEAQSGDERFARAEVVVWKGFCHVHTAFTVEHVERIRQQYPGVHVIVHPECPREVVAKADSAGSTEAIVKKVREASAGETVCVGTELNLVSRLARRRPEVKIVPLSASVCPNMAKITLANLLWTIENLGSHNKVEVDPEISKEALLALERMLEIA